ncbi:MAG: DNA polymerase I, partial [Patescibacteria group bacterium]
TIMTDAPIKFDLDATKVAGFDSQAVFKLFQELGFKSLLSRLPEQSASGAIKAEKKQGDLFGGQSPESTRLDSLSLVDARRGVQSPESRIQSGEFKIREGYHLINDEKSYQAFVKELKKQEVTAIDTETTGLDTLTAKLLGIGFCWQEGIGYYLAIKKTVPAEVKEILADDKVKKIGHNLKYDIEILEQAGAPVYGLYFDTMIASYLLDPGTRAHDLDSLAFSEFGYQMTPITDLIGAKGKDQITLETVAMERVADYCIEDADYTWRLYQKLDKEVEKKNILGLLEKMEMPLVSVLARMELGGVKIDTRFLKKLDTRIEKDRQALDKKIYRLAGKSFNIDSPLQLKEILFDRLKISIQGLKKGKTGISTAAAELEKLRGVHPIIDLISDHREIAKLQSTYTQALPELVNPATGRVHTSFNQTVTATGRLSSSNPNLQNIPIRTELGKEIRKAFVAESGCQILAADYSQIELRIVASLAKDQKMMEIFEAGLDIHAATAAEINGVPLAEVTSEMRRKAKAVNFGILYGMGAYGLSWRAGISREEAQEFISKYFDTFTGVKDYLEETIRLARQDGFVETLFGRVRYLSDINSGVAQVRNAAERMAVNAPIQGTAADLIKLAMIEVDRKISERWSPADVRMVLQVHDELVFEVKEKLVEEVGQLVKETMENVYKLRVPVVVDVEVGENWGELEELKIKN